MTPLPSPNIIDIKKVEMHSSCCKPIVPVVHNGFLKGRDDLKLLDIGNIQN